MQVAYLNPAAKGLFGYSTAEAASQTLDFFLHATSLGFYQVHIAGLAQKEPGTSFPRMENRLIFGKHRDGHIIPLDMSLTRREWRGQPFLVCIPRDISNQIAYQQALRENELQFRAVFMEHSTVMLLVEPQSGQIIEANSAERQAHTIKGASSQSRIVSRLQLPPRVK